MTFQISTADRSAAVAHVRREHSAARQRTIGVLGHHEGDGIPPEGLAQLDMAVEIPMIGTGCSLTVAVAGSLVRYKLAGML
jgi:tRNA G18 (ribose-2'-O)-methylase SpoU